MTDRPRAERIEGKTVLYKRGVFSCPLSPDDVLALAEELVTLARIARMCEGQIPNAAVSNPRR